MASPYFHRRDQALFVEEVALATVAERFGTPTYVYSRAGVRANVAAMRDGLAPLKHHLCYAVKANANSAVLDMLHQLGCDFDAVSVGELAHLQRLGIDGARIIVSGVGKRDDEIAAALKARVCYIAIESESELQAVARIARELGTRAPVAVRVNPDVDAHTHPHIATGMKENKFGVPMDAAPALYMAGMRMPEIDLCGVTCHIGSQVLGLEPFRDAAVRMAALVQHLGTARVPLRYLGMGGGLGIAYRDEVPPTAKAYGETLAQTLGTLGLTLVVEPGRVIVGNTAVLVTRVTRTKRGADRQFVICDAGMTDLMRPALYGAYHRIETVAAPRGAEAAVDVVGPVCESTDVFASARPLPPVNEGDLLALYDVGAYGAAMSSQYNGRPRAAEVMCDGATMTLVRERETFDDLWRGERRLDGTPI